MRQSVWKRVFAGLLTVALLAGYFPGIGASAADVQDLTHNVADPETLTRPTAIYGDNTINAGKITVGKSVEAAENGTLSVTVNGKTVTGDPENFLVTITQTAQVMGLTSESAVPLDVVFVLDTSGSMGTEVEDANDDTRIAVLRETVNDAIETLMNNNAQNRVGVVAFSAYNTQAGTAGPDAANVLSELNHYTGEAASEHLTWGRGYCNWANGTVTTIQGRSLTDGQRNSRYSSGGATNIQAGIALGAKMLLETEETTAIVDGKEVDRIPFLIVLSDGAPVCSSSNNDWINPSMTMSQGTNYDLYAGNSFLPMLTAAYYKEQISNHYAEDLTVYTMGFAVNAGETDLSAMTLNPSQELTNTSNDWYTTINNYWTSYRNEEQFRIQVGRPNAFEDLTDDNRPDWYYTFYPTQTEVHINNVNDIADNTTRIPAETFYADQLSRTDRYVTFADNIYPVSSLAYNDGYYSATSAAELQEAFSNILENIQLKAISSPTKVTDSGDFSGYVNFYDPIGEYMEVKDMKGIVANGNFYQGRTFGVNLQSGADAEFNETFKRVLTERLKLSQSNINVDDFIADARINAKGTNSFCWWGSEYDVGEEDIAMQVLGSAQDDSIAYIEANKASYPKATHVCRSYFFYGTAGNTAINPNHEYLYFVIRVQRSLEAPYQQTVVISAPASLLSMEKVAITRDINGNYTAQVIEDDPARVIYEVGLRSDINPQNVKEIVAADYAAEAPADGKGSVNYDAETDTYYFFTNDWNRSASQSSHHRAQAKATFDAAADNSYYTYQEDTVLLVKDGDNYVPYTGTQPVAGQTYYYARTYFDWAGSTANADGKFPCTQKTTYIPVTVPSGESAAGHMGQNAAGQWYIKKGTYTASTVVAADDTIKSENTTDTAATVMHVHNTTNLTNSHYTVLLGNNGRLALTADTVKTVTGTRPTDTTIKLEDGSPVTVGDELTYTIKVVNNEDKVADATVTDVVPKGTEFISADPAVQPDANGKLTWNLTDIPAGEIVYVSFKVKVTEEALSDAVISVDNTATVQIDDDPAYDTNTTHNPPFGKTVQDVNNAPLPADGVQVGQVLVYRIRYTNDQTSAATVTITDTIPAGTKYLENTASHADYLKVAGPDELVWEIPNVGAGVSGVVSFRVVVDASAKTVIRNEATIKIGDNEPKVYTETKVKTGNLSISKIVDGGTKDTFKIQIREAAGDLDGKYATKIDDVAVDPVEFVDGLATLEIKKDQTIEIFDLPANASLSVAETEIPSGYTATYTGLTGGIVVVPAGATADVAVTNTYSTTPVEFQFTGEKVFTGTTPVDVTFSFTAQACKEDGTVITGEGAITVSDSVTYPAGTYTAENGTARIAFPKRTFTDKGTHYYLITETVSNVPGVNYDATRYLLKVEVKDDGEGNLTVTPTLTNLDTAGTPETLTFTNSYTPKEISLTLEGTKELTGRTLKANEFSFEVKEGDTVVARGINNADSSISFSPITYTATGTHTYTITEVVSNIPGVTYSTQSYTVTVKVEDVNGQLTAVPTYPAGGVVFTNKFVPTEVEVNLEAQKVLSGGTLEANDFTFTVTEYTVVEGQKVYASAPVSEAVNDKDGNVTFSAIGYSVDMLNGAASKVFYYEIKEIVPDLGKIPFVVYSTETYTAEVTVTYDADEGKLSASAPVYKDANGNTIADVPTFTNVLNGDTVTITPAALYKQVTGANTPDNAVFSFSIVDMDGNVVATGQNAAGTAGGAIVPVNFSSLTYKKEADTYDTDDIYYYWVMETNAGKASSGIKYDSTRYLLKVTVKYDGTQSKLVATAEYFAFSGTGEPTANQSDYTTPVTPVNTTANFTNEYSASGMVTIEATKNMTGRRTLQAGDFDFILEPTEENPGEPTLYGTNAAADGNGNGKITFGNLYYTNDSVAVGQTKEIFYRMRELAVEGNTIPGVTYDKTVYYVKVVLDHEGDGVIKTDVFYYADEGCTIQVNAEDVVFQNSYLAKNVTLEIDLTKELTGRDLKADEFGFQLLHYNPTTKEETTVEAASNDANGKVKFLHTYYAETFPTDMLGKDIYYLIREVKGGLGGVTYSDAVFGVKVVITDNTTTGELELTKVYYEGDTFETVLTSESGITFTNEYVAKDTSFTPEAFKELTGRNMNDDEFMFEVKAFDAEYKVEGDVVSRGLSKKTGEVVFTPIHYPDLPGAGQTMTFHYVISEVPGTLGGVNYDMDVYYLKVDVTDDSNGNINAVGSYYSDNGFEEPIDVVIFENTYTVKDAILQLEANKVLTGRNMVEGEFDFVVMEGDTPVAYGTNQAAEDGQPGKIDFTTLAYDQDDLGGAETKEFTYTIHELVPSDAERIGITTDPTVYTVKVTLTHDNNGNLIATPAYFVGDVAVDGVVEFKNTYEPDPVEVTLQAWKYLTNKTLQVGEFSFQLLDAEGKVVETVTNKKADDTSNGLVEFSTLTFTKPGIYVYQVKEAGSVKLDPEVPGEYQYDKSIYTVTITVRDDATGQLKAQVAYSKVAEIDDVPVDSIAFINSYTPPELKINLTEEIGATKTLNGRDLEAGEFKFRVIDVAGNVMASGTNDADGKIIFDEFTFTTAGIYNYRVEEILTDKDGNDLMPGGVTGDARQWRVRIHVRYNENDGVLYINPQTHDEPGVIVRDLNNVHTEAAFENTYTAKPVTVTIPVTKQLEGRPLQAGEFLFQLWEGNILRDEIRNGGEGHVNFNLTYTKPGVYTYTVQELIPETKLPGVTYSTNVENVTVTVSDNGKGNLVASVALDESQVFVNTYEAEDGVAVIQVEKLVEIPVGSSYAMAGGEFTFQLLDEDGKVIATAKNDTNGYASFQLTYTDEQLAGEAEKLFHYTVQELIPETKLPGVTYDTKIHKVDVLVKDDYSGKLVTEISYLDDIEGAVVFQNKYDITGSGMVEIFGTKTYLDDQGETLALEAGAFSFGLYQDGKLVGEAVKNDANGKFAFLLTYGLEDIGTHKYTIKEIAGTNPSITYDETVYDVEVTVADNKAGGLTVTYTVGGKVGGTADFKNVYSDPDPLDVTIQIQKQVENKTKPGIGLDGFVIVLEQGEAQYTDTTDDKGKAGFTLRFDADDIGKTFEMKVYEKKGNATGVTYDTTVYTLAVKISQNADGSLKATIDGQEKNTITLKFTNTYSAPGTPPTGDNSMIYPMLAMMALSALGCIVVLMLLWNKRSFGTYRGKFSK